MLEAGTTRLWLDVKNITIDGKSTEEGREASARACERACEICLLYTSYFKAVDGVFAVGADQTGATLPMYAYAADAAPAQGSLCLLYTSRCV